MKLLPRRQPVLRANCVSGARALAMKASSGIIPGRVFAQNAAAWNCASDCVTIARHVPAANVLFKTGVARVDFQESADATNSKALSVTGPMPHSPRLSRRCNISANSPRTFNKESVTTTLFRLVPRARPPLRSRPNSRDARASSNWLQIARKMTVNRCNSFYGWIIAERLEKGRAWQEGRGTPLLCSPPAAEGIHSQLRVPRVTIDFLSVFLRYLGNLYNVTEAVQSAVRVCLLNRYRAGDLSSTDDCPSAFKRSLTAVYIWAARFLQSRWPTTAPKVPRQPVCPPRASDKGTNGGERRREEERARRSGVGRAPTPRGAEDRGRGAPLFFLHRQDFRMQIERHESSPFVPWGQNLLRWLWTVDAMPGFSRLYRCSRACVRLDIYTPSSSSTRSGVTIGTNRSQGRVRG